jgi:hypothetical protein
LKYVESEQSQYRLSTPNLKPLISRARARARAYALTRTRERMRTSPVYTRRHSPRTPTRILTRPHEQLHTYTRNTHSTHKHTAYTPSLCLYPPRTCYAYYVCTHLHANPGAYPLYVCARVPATHVYSPRMRTRMPTVYAYVHSALYTYSAPHVEDTYPLVVCTCMRAPTLITMHIPAR